MGLHPSPETLPPLLEALEKSPAADTHLRHTIRLAIRNHLKLPEAFAELPENLSQENQADLAAICLAVPGPASAKHLALLFAGTSPPADQLSKVSAQIARQLGNAAAEPLTALAQKHWPEDPETQATIFLALLEGRGVDSPELPESTRNWGKKLAVTLAAPLPQTAQWSFQSQDKPDNSSFFALQERKCEDDRAAIFLSSLPNNGNRKGEETTGTLQSPIFRTARKAELLCLRPQRGSQRP